MQLTFKYQAFFYNCNTIYTISIIHLYCLSVPKETLADNISVFLLHLNFMKNNLASGAAFNVANFWKTPFGVYGNTFVYCHLSVTMKCIRQEELQLQVTIQ